MRKFVLLLSIRYRSKLFKKRYASSCDFNEKTLYLSSSCMIILWLSLDIIFSEEDPMYVLITCSIETLFFLLMWNNFSGILYLLILIMLWSGSSSSTDTFLPMSSRIYKGEVLCLDFSTKASSYVTSLPLFVLTSKIIDSFSLILRS